VTFRSEDAGHEVDVGPRSETTAAERLRALLAESRARTVAVIGLCKNAGKTTVVNTLLSAVGDPHGITSLGLDGEAVDHLTGLAKPRVVPSAGTLVATTRGSLRRSQAELDEICELPFRTPLGRVVLGRAPGDRAIEISGPTTLAQLRGTVAALHDAGARTVLVDGALNRLGSAAPAVSDGVIMAAGAAAGDDLDEAVRVAEEAFAQLTLPAADAAERRLAGDAKNDGTRLLSIDAGGSAVALSFSTAVGEGATVVRDIERLGSRALILRGALTQDFADDLVRLLPHGRRVRLVVRDATVCILPPAWLARLRGRGVEVVVLHPLRVLAVTTNPFRLPRPLNPRLFFDAVAGVVAGRAPVFDVINGLRREAATAAGPERFTAAT
jgi:hypothetical protein